MRNIVAFIYAISPIYETFSTNNFMLTFLPYFMLTSQAHYMSVSHTTLCYSSHPTTVLLHTQFRICLLLSFPPNFFCIITQLLNCFKTLLRVFLPTQLRDCPSSNYCLLLHPISCLLPNPFFPMGSVPNSVFASSPTFVLALHPALKLTTNSTLCLPSHPILYLLPNTN